MTASKTPKERDPVRWRLSMLLAELAAMGAFAPRLRCSPELYDRLERDIGADGKVIMVQLGGDAKTMLIRSTLFEFESAKEPDA